MDTTERKRAVLREGRLDNLAGIEAYNGGANIVRAEAVANDGLMRLIEQKRLKKKSTQADRDVLLRAQNLTDERNAQQEALNGALALADTGKEDKWKKLRNSSYNRMATGKETRKLDELKRQENLDERAVEAAPAGKKAAAEQKLIDNNREIVEVRNNLIRLNKETGGDTPFTIGTTFDTAEAYYGTSADDRQKLDEDIAKLRDRVSKESGKAVKNAIDEVTTYNGDDNRKGVSDFLGNTRRRNYMLNRHELDTQSAIPSTHSEATVNLGLDARKIYGGKQQAGDLAEKGVGYVGEKLGRLYDFLGNVLGPDDGLIKFFNNKVKDYKERKGRAEAEAVAAEAERKEAEAEVQRKISKIIRAQSRVITAGIQAEIRRLKEEKRLAENVKREAAVRKAEAKEEAKEAKDGERRVVDGLKELAQNAKQQIASAKGVVTEGTRNFLQGALGKLRVTAESVSRGLEEIRRRRAAEAKTRNEERERKIEAEEQTGGFELIDFAAAAAEPAAAAAAEEGGGAPAAAPEGGGAPAAAEEGGGAPAAAPEGGGAPAAAEEGGGAPAPAAGAAEPEPEPEPEPEEEPEEEEEEEEEEEPEEEPAAGAAGVGIPPPPLSDAPGFKEASEYVQLRQSPPGQSPLSDPVSPTQRGIKSQKEERARRKREAEAEEELEKARKKEIRRDRIKAQREAREAGIGGLDDPNFVDKGYENIGGGTRPLYTESEFRQLEKARRTAEAAKAAKAGQKALERQGREGPNYLSPLKLKKKKRKSPIKKKKKSKKEEKKKKKSKKKQ